MKPKSVTIMKTINIKTSRNFPKIHGLSSFVKKKKEPKITRWKIPRAHKESLVNPKTCFLTSYQEDVYSVAYFLMSFMLLEQLFLTL